MDLAPALMQTIAPAFQDITDRIVSSLSVSHFSRMTQLRSALEEENVKRLINATVLMAILEANVRSTFVSVI